VLVPFENIQNMHAILDLSDPILHFKYLPGCVS